MGLEHEASGLLSRQQRGPQLPSPNQMNRKMLVVYSFPHSILLILPGFQVCAERLCTMRKKSK